MFLTNKPIKFKIKDDVVDGKLICIIGDSLFIEKSNKDIICVDILNVSVNF